MKNSKSALASSLILIVAFAMLFSRNAFAQIPMDALKYIPVNYQYVSVLDVQRFIQSDLYTRSQPGQQLIGEIGEDLADFVKITGVDPARDISRLVSAKAQFPMPFQNVIVATGRFNKKEIKRYISSNTRLDEWKHGMQPIAIQNGMMSVIQKAIAFLSDQQIAMGPPQSLEGIFDVSTGKNKSILSDPLMNSLINSFPPDEMFWFAGKAAFVLAKAPVPTPIGEHGRFVQSTVGVFNITDKVVGKIRITSESANASTNLVNYYKKIASVTQLFEDPNAGLKLLSEGFTVEQDGSLITMSLNFPADVLPKIWQWSTHPDSDAIGKNKTSEPSKPMVKSTGTIDPVILFQPMPSYTEEARKNRIQGRIVLDLIVRKDGVPSNIMIRKKLGYGLDESAINTIASRWRFLPGIVDGKPVDLMATIEVAFNIF